MNSAGHLTAEEPTAYARRDGTLSAAERLAISDHAAGCAVCCTQLAGAAGAPPDLARVFTGLIEDGRQEETSASENWTGADEFTSAVLPEPTPAERAANQAFETRMSRFSPEHFAPGGTLGAAQKTATRRESVATAAPWWQGLFSWPGLTLAGAMAAIVLTLIIALPRGGRVAGSGPVAAATKPASGATLVDGPVQVGADGALAGLASIPEDLREAVLETVRRGAAPGTLLGKLTRGGGTEPGGAQATSIVDGMAVSTPISPVSTSVDTDQPVFRWKAAGPVQIVVRPSAGGEEIRSVPLPAETGEWTPPTPLGRGALYRWQIVVLTPGGEEITGTRAGAVFKVLSADAHERLEALRAGASGRSHLTLGVAYAREGLKEESAREFRALKESNAQSVLAKRLVDSVEGRGG